MPLFYSAGTDAAGGALGMGSMLLPLLLGVPRMYFQMIPSDNMQKAPPELNHSCLKKADLITTVRRMAGKNLHVKDADLVISTSDYRVRMELAKWAVSTNNSNAPEDKKGKKKDEPAQIEEGSDGEKN